jgi:flagellar biosynthesis GTPase FlhF
MGKSSLRHYARPRVLAFVALTATLPVNAAAQDRAQQPAFQDIRRLPLSSAEEARRKADEAERQHAAEAEARQRAEDERQRLAAAAEAKRKADEAERQRAAEAEARKRAEDERQRLAAAAEAKRKADEAERQRAAEAEAHRRAEEERRRLATAADASRAVASTTTTSAAGGRPSSAWDGTYALHVRAACNEPFQSVMMRVAGRTVTFEHLLQSVPYGWRGSIDEAGNVDIAVAGGNGFVGSGSLAQNRIELSYPQCGRSPIVMQVRMRTN